MATKQKVAKMGSLLLALIYVCFVSLGLPDSLLGSAWPVVQQQMGVPVWFAGLLSSIICVGTVFSSLVSDRLLAKFGAGKVTAVSIALTALALFGFSASNKFWMLVMWAIPYGLGAGGVDAILNNYVALHYKPQHMSWLHCMWGVGASASPFVMSFALVKLQSWNWGYLIVAIAQTVLCIGVFCSVPLWKKQHADGGMDAPTHKALSFKQIVETKGAVACFLLFFFYCALEVTASLWASTYLVQQWSFSAEDAASYASMFYIGLTVGRFVNGFLAMKLSDKVLIRTGSVVIAVGTALMFVPTHVAFALVGMVVVGVGCAPVYPCIIHMTPSVFGKEKSQAMIGVQMAFAYVGFLVMPPLFGVMAEHLSVALLPVFLAVLLALVVALHEVVVRSAKHQN